jgi:small-conductance mechanosensitive channel
VQWLSEVLGLSTTETKIAQTVVLLVTVLLIRWVSLRATRQRVDDPDIAYRIRKAIAYVLATVTLVAVVVIWLEPLGNLGTFLGLLSAGIAVALADLIRNFAGWTYIVTRRPFKVDDRIQVGERAGDVIDIRMFRTSMLEIRDWVSADQSTGRIVHVPNGVFLSEAVHNFTEGFGYLWHELRVLVTFESDWQRAEERILAVLDELGEEIRDAATAEIRRAGRHYKIRYSHLTPTVYVSVGESGVMLTGRFLVPVRQRRAFDQRAWRGILAAFAEEPAVELAYRTFRSYRPEAIPDRRGDDV